MYNHKNLWWLNFCDQLKFKVFVFVDIPVDLVSKCKVPVIFTKIAHEKSQSHSRNNEIEQLIWSLICVTDLNS